MTGGWSLVVGDFTMEGALLTRQVPELKATVQVSLFCNEKRSGMLVALVLSYRKMSQATSSRYGLTATV